MQKKIKLALLNAKLFLGIILICFCTVFYGCGSSGNIADWADSENVIRVSNLRGRVIAPINDSFSNRASSNNNEVCFSLLSTQGTKVFIEDSMNEESISTLPIIDDKKKFIGAVSMKEIARYLVDSEQDTLNTSSPSNVSTIFE